jgi:hypothetical protein
LVTAERHLVVVVRDDVLPKFGADPLEEESQMSNHGVVVQDRVTALRDVPNGEARQSCRHPAAERSQSHRSRGGVGQVDATEFGTAPWLPSERAEEKCSERRADRTRVQFIR